MVDSLDIHGYLRIKAPNVTVKNTIVRGSQRLTGSMALVQSSSTGTRIIDSELVAAYPSYYIDGIVGSGFTLTRVNIHGVVDSVKVTGNDVLVQDSWLHDNLYYATTPWGKRHPQRQRPDPGRQQIAVRNSSLSGTKNAAVMITQDAGPVTGFVFTGNTADNGACTMNLAEKSYGPISATITNNTFGTSTKVDHCAVIAKDTTQAASTITGNSSPTATPSRSPAAERHHDSAGAPDHTVRGPGLSRRRARRWRAGDLKCGPDLGWWGLPGRMSSITATRDRRTAEHRAATGDAGSNAGHVAGGQRHPAPTARTPGGPVGAGARIDGVGSTHERACDRARGRGSAPEPASRFEDVAGTGVTVFATGTVCGGPTDVELRDRHRAARPGSRAGTPHPNG